MRFSKTWDWMNNMSMTFSLSKLTVNIFCILNIFIRSDQISRSVVSDSFPPHESQHARPPCPSPTPRVHSDSHPSSQWCHPAISSSVVPFSSCPQSLRASESFPTNFHFHHNFVLLQNIYACDPFQKLNQINQKEQQEEVLLTIFFLLLLASASPTFGEVQGVFRKQSPLLCSPALSCFCLIS